MERDPVRLVSGRAARVERGERARSRQRWRGAWLLAIAAGAFVGCQTAGPKPAGVSTVAPAVQDLMQRPLYTFNETDLDRYLRGLRTIEPELTARVVRLGRQNIGKPYEIYLLGEFPFELYDPDPIYCLSKSDCLTFCEHMYAMALSRDWWSFLQTLQRLRYRDGIITMLTRNHYTEADWDRNNAFLFEDLTATLGAGQVCVPLRETIKRATFFAKFGIGQDIPAQSFEDRYIPKERVPEILAELRAGDFVNIVRGDADSQYVGHTGLIAIAADGTVDFLHSAQPAVREQPLTDFLAKDRRCVGIKILRLRPDAQQRLDAALAAPSPATPVSEATLQSALATSPLMSTGAPTSYSQDWARAMNMQNYRLTYDSPLDPNLQAALEAADRTIGDELGIPPAERALGVLDLTDLRLAAVQPDVMFYGASVPKICIVLTYFDQHPEAATSLDPEIEHELERVIKRSDNDLAAKYSQLVGLDQIQKLIESPRYHFYDKEHGGGLWCGKHYGVAEPRSGDPLHDHSHGATVRQCLRYYLMLEQGNLVSAPVCAKLKQIFAAPDLEFHNDRFVRGLAGRDVTILRKSGLWEDWHLDTARVQHGDRLYLLAGMTQHAKGEEYLAKMAAAVDEVLCGPQPRVPFAHQLILQRAADEFRGGTLERGQLNNGEPGVVLTCPASGEAASYESPAVATDIRFNELLLSWNVATPAEAGFCVEARVGRSWDGVWSPYLYFGDCGDTVPPGERVVAADEGKMDVDYFRSAERFDRVQYRVRAQAAPGHANELRVERIAICVSDTTGIPPSVLQPTTVSEPAPAAAWQRHLDVPFRSQKTDRPEMKHKICSPTSVGMVLAYRGVVRTSEEVAESCFDPTHQIWGNWPRNVQGAYSFGVPGYLARFSDWADVERMIAAGQPLVISIRVNESGGLRGAPYDTTDGHLIVITGFDANGNVLVNDPAVATAEKGQLAYRRPDLEQVWMRAAGGTAYVLLARE